MSLSLVSAPARVVDEMAEALPVCLVLAAKQVQQTVFKDFFFSAAMPDKSTNEGQRNFVRRVRGFFVSAGVKGVVGGGIRTT